MTTQESKATRMVMDERGNSYELAEVLGEGGQGVVHVVKGGGLLVKRLKARGNDPEARNRLQRQVDFVKRLPLEDVPIAAPLATLREPDLGYVMEFLAEMVPLVQLAHPPRGTTDLGLWYRTTGGLKRRLRLLGKLATALARLHGEALVYGDPSTKNLYVSAALSHEEVRLIDADNLRYDAGTAGAQVYTPGYGAPEVVRGLSGVNTLTDAHAFAVVAFEVLAIAHPLLGDQVMAGEPELEAEALEGRLPWVDHATDDRNRSRHGIQDRARVMPPRLQELFRRTFEEGLENPALRPRMTEWIERLEAVANVAILCADLTCGHTFVGARNHCPWCNAPAPRRVFVKILPYGQIHPEHPDLGVIDMGRQALYTLCGGENEVLYVNEQQGRGDRSRSGTDRLLGLRMVKDHLAARCRQGERILITREDGTLVRELAESTVSLPLSGERWIMHFGPLDGPHRVARVWCG